MEGNYYRAATKTVLFYRTECWTSKKQHISKMCSGNGNAKMDVQEDWKTLN